MSGLTHEDWMNVIGSALGACGIAISALIAWIMRHSSRITRVEARQDAAERIATEDRQYIRASLIRIEDKIDRKVDKP